MVTVFSTRAPSPVRLARDVRPRVGKVEVGACPLSATFVTRTEIQECARPTDDGIQALDSDVHANLVWSDPSSLRASAKTFADLAASAPTEEIRKAQQAIADAQNAEADRLEARAAGKSAAQVRAEETYGASFTTFKADWDSFYAANVTSDSGEAGNSTITQINEYDAQYRTYVDGYKKLTGKAPTVVPPAPGGGSFDWSTYIFWGLVIGGVIAAGVLLGNLRRMVP